MKEILLCKYGELTLKGLNRGYFEKLLRRELEKRLKDLCNVRYITMDDDTISSPCAIEISYEAGLWLAWLTDCAGSSHTAEAYRYIDGEVIDGALKVGMGYDITWKGECADVFADCGATLEEALDKLAAKVALLRQEPDCCLVFTWDD